MRRARAWPARVRRARLLTALVVAVACSTDPLSAPIIGVVRIELGGEPADSVMLLGATRTLTAVAIGPGDSLLEDRQLEWQSSDSGIISVNAEGRVEAIAEGDAEISAHAEGLSRSVTLSSRPGTTVPNGGTRHVTILGGKLRLSVPAGVAPTGTVIHAREALTWPEHERILAGSVMEIGPAGTELGANITVGITYVPADIPADERSNLRLHAVQANGTWAELPNGSVDLNNSRVNGGLIRLTKVAIFRAEPED